MYGINAIIASSSFTYKNNKIYQNDVELTDVAVAGKKQYITISSASELMLIKDGIYFIIIKNSRIFLSAAR